MEKNVLERLLFDFYGELLTDKQKMIMDYYYNDDYNLAEIGDVVHVTRQGVYDVVKRSKATMIIIWPKSAMWFMSQGRASTTWSSVPKRRCRPTRTS